jgi:glutamate racemase
MHLTQSEYEASSPIGIFDSGVGGLSILRHIHALLPDEALLYFADSGFAPYGEKPEAVIVERALLIADFLLQQHCKAIVVACNTATAAAIAALREKYPSLTVVGVEPGLKPAAAQTKSKIVGVLATERTLASDKFQALHEQQAASGDVRFLQQACVGLADQIEKGELASIQTVSLVRRYVEPLITQGADTLVLGCTHYPFVLEQIETVIKSLQKEVSIIDTGAAVARHLQRLLEQSHLYHPLTTKQAPLTAFTTGSHSSLRSAFKVLLGLTPEVSEVSVAPT